MHDLHFSNDKVAVNLIAGGRYLDDWIEGLFMESSTKYSGGVEIPKRKRSLDLKSFCKSKFPKSRANKRKVPGENNRDDVKTKKSKIQTDVPMSSYESDTNGRSKGLHGISLALGNNGTSFNVPKRPRGSVGRKNPESDQCSESSRLSNSVDGVGATKPKVIKSSDISNSRLSRKSVGSDAKSKQKVDPKPTVDSSSSNVKLKQKVGDKKDSRADLVVNYGDTSAKKWRTHSRKRSDLETSIRKSEPSSVSNSLFSDDEDDDEENLEQNAARMLSSRFDPSCTGFSSKKNSSASQTADELSFLVSSARDSVSRWAKSSDGEDYSRALRPRRGDKGKCVSKIRRHFYEVRGRDVDPYWVLKRRIKIFWPLDDSWYDGIVNDYHKKTKLHHIKYADRDEEWVDLGEEKFKLLLLRSEVPGKAKSRKRVNNLRIGQTVQPGDDNSSIGNSLESEPIALWLASQSQRVKALSKSSKRRKTEKTDISEDDVDDSRITRNRPGCDIDKSTRGVNCQSDKHMVYVRKKYPKKSAEKRSAGVCMPTTKGDKFYHGCVDSDKQLWSFDVKGKLTFNIASLESKEFRFQICLPLLPYLEFLCGIWSFRMLQDIVMHQHGVIMTTSPAVFLEMLFIDSNLGLRFILYEGCLKQALAIVFQILIVFGQSDERWKGDKNLPVTSMRFQLSSVHDLRKQHVFEVYSFSKLQSSKWLYLQSKILQQCLLSKQLSFSECTYGNIKKLECGIFQKCKPRVGLERFSTEYFKKKFELGKVSQLPTFFLNSHLQSLMKHSPARANLQHQDAMSSQETSQKDGQPVEECAQFEPSSAAAKDITTQHEIRQLDSETPAFRGLSSYQRMDGPIPNSNPIGSKNSSKRGRSSPISSPIGINFMPNGFSNGPKKPRTQVQYTLPFEGYDSSKKQEMPSSGSLPCKRIRRASLRRLSDGSVNNHKNSESLTCSANVLVTNEEKGWRECGAHIVLEVADDNEWRLAVKLSGVTRFSYKVKHILQLGSSNRYSHAMIWKGGKDWVLEFPDRSQWMLFKEMYEECYDRNIRAASVKNIPIPGVRLVDESDGYGDGIPFVRNSIVYFRQVQTDAEMAMDRSRILYDMDSDDEEWLMARKNCAEKRKYEQISDEFLEMAMDMFEKVSYAQRRESFADAEVEELAVGLGSVEAVKLVYLHWRQKREKMRMPLIRHFQPPPWERYHQQLKEWEQNVARGSCAVSVGDQEKEKPAMFAFCLKPRGLDVPNRGSKQRSQRRLSVSGNHHAFSTDRDRRRPNGHAFVDEFSDVSPSLHPSARIWSPRDARFSLSTKWKVKHKLWNFKELDISNLDEFHLRDALGAAQHARKLAKFKKEKAQRLLCRADLAIHKAVTTLMNAEAMKDCSQNSNGVN
ncbi:DNA mismatch repair protein msh6 [Phtheirospermum japonicum]|uniref:Enhancer of polycomb-like protein n=1 Tax=Phtheirospermum japonicum TaxID=374723 RepID=A0A830B151_9LAMI|nr:DNA mismatch repair protein msh6 [Phtheirospermum japonicum]